MYQKIKKLIEHFTSYVLQLKIINKLNIFHYFSLNIILLLGIKLKTVTVWRNDIVKTHAQ